MSGSLTQYQKRKPEVFLDEKCGNNMEKKRTEKIVIVMYIPHDIGWICSGSLSQFQKETPDHFPMKNA